MTRVVALHPRLRRTTRLLACAFVFALGASGCTGLVYNRLDTLAGWYLGSLVSLDSEQRRDLRAWLTRMHQWHRASELGRYAAFLRALAEQVAKPGDRAAYSQIEAQIETFGETVVMEATPEAARLLSGLSDAQLDELDENLEERALENVEKSQKAIDKGVWRKERQRDMRRQMKRWTGSVTDEQQALLAETVEQLESTAHDWADSQRQWRRLLIATLRTRPATPMIEQQVLQLLRAPDAQWTPAYTAKNERNRERTLALLEQLDASLTPKQRERLRRELEDLAEQLEELKGDLT